MTGSGYRPDGVLLGPAEPREDTGGGGGESRCYCYFLTASDLLKDEVPFSRASCTDFRQAHLTCPKPPLGGSGYFYPNDMCSYNPLMSPLSSLIGLELAYKYSYNWVTKYHEPPNCDRNCRLCLGLVACEPRPRQVVHRSRRSHH